MIRRPPRSTQSRSSAASDVYKRQPVSLAFFLLLDSLFQLLLLSLGGAFLLSGENIPLAQYQIIFAAHFDFRAPVLRVNHDVPWLDFQRNKLAFLVASRSYGKHLAFLGLLLRGIRYNDTACGLILALAGLNDYPVSQRLQIHVHPSSFWSLACLLYTSDAADDLLCVDLGGRR